MSNTLYISVIKPYSIAKAIRNVKTNSKACSMVKIINILPPHRVLQGYIDNHLLNVQLLLYR